MAPSVFNRSSSVSLSSLEDFCHHEQDASDSVAPPSPIAASFVFSQSSDCSTATENSELLDFDLAPQPCSSFLAFRLNYILVNLVVMLADGLQGTHLYLLYESYGFSAASLYCTGFVAGAITAPITGPLIDKFGRKRSALVYCILEIGINVLEQYPFFVGIVFSRIMGGVTTNLLSSVFETWLDTEYCRRGFEKSQYEIIMRDAVVVKNLAAIASGYLAHILAEHAGPVGPFRGAVFCTAVALVVIVLVWTENFGCGGGEDFAPRNLPAMMKDIVTACKSDFRVLRVGVTQGLTMATLFIFVFLWVPILQGLAKSAPSQTVGLDSRGEPAYGLIFGAFMAAGVFGGVISPYFRRSVALFLSPLEAEPHPDIEREDRPLSVELVAAFSYILASVMLLVPCMVQNVDPTSFSRALGAFVLYELLVGLYMPCEGVIRSLYIPSDSRASLMTIPNVVVNVLVVGGVVATKFVSMQTVSGITAGLMAVAAVLQLTLVSQLEWDGLSERLNRIQKQSLHAARVVSLSVIDALQSRLDKILHQSPSMRSSTCLGSFSYWPVSSSLLSDILSEAGDWIRQTNENNRDRLKEE